MTEIKPFNAVTYNQEEIRDLSGVVCPPYDIISDSGRQHFYDKSPYNFIHILLAKEAAGQDKYHRAAAYFSEWLKNKILVQNAQPAIYFYVQQYNIQGEKRKRLGFISLLHLGKGKESAFTHEHTRLEAKEDRLKLLRQVKANLSPIFVIFSDKKRMIQRIFEQHIQAKAPFIDIVDDEKIAHKVWKLDSPEILRKMQADMRAADIFIADGHHRFEVACAYRDEMDRKLGGSVTAKESFNYMLAYFTDADSRDLLILPIHRLLKPDKSLDAEAFKAELKNYFDVEEFKDKKRFFFLMEKGGRTEHALGLYINKEYWLLRLKNVRILDKLIGDKPKVFRELDVCILNNIILKNILKVDLEDKERLVFSASAEEFIAEVNKNPACVAFFLNPVKIKQMMSVALDRERMPAKSTYFYPKVLSGLVINKLEED